MITILGAGKVGSAIAFLCGSAGLDNITLVNRDQNKASGEALDISNAIPNNSAISIRATSDYSQIKNSSVIVIAASVKEHSISRSDILLEQAAMIRDLSGKISEFSPNSKVLVVTNPVDVMTYLVQKVGKLASKNVLGVASSLDSARFRYLLAQKLGTDQSQIHDAIVMGEHDDSMVPIFSQAKFGKTPVDNMLDENQKSQITSDVRNYWKTLRNYKGSSVFGIAKNTFDVIESMIQNRPLNVCASVLLDGQYGLSDVCVGVPVVISKNGIDSIYEIPMSDVEKEQFYKSASRVKNNTATANEFLKSR